ncbi:MAG: hypothetical protein ACKO91_10950 [Acidimicrobiales bacterium]
MFFRPTMTRSFPLLEMRRAWGRRRLLRLAAVTVTGGMVAGCSWWLTAQAAAARDAWGEARTVLVTTRAVEAGAALDGLVEARAIPVAALPDGALESLPRTARARHPLSAGAVVTGVAVAGTAPSPTAAAIPPGWRGLAVARSEVGLPVRVGDAVEVMAIGELDGDVGRPVSGIVAGVDDRAVTVAVPADAVVLVATAIHDRRVVLTLRTS